MNLYVGTMKFYCFVLHENCSFLLHMYVICEFGDQIMCESLLFIVYYELNKLQANPDKKIIFKCIHYFSMKITKKSLRKHGF
jgi:hypothetical protein